MKMNLDGSGMKSLHKGFETQSGLTFILLVNCGSPIT